MPQNAPEIHQKQPSIKKQNTSPAIAHNRDLSDIAEWRAKDAQLNARIKLEKNPDSQNPNALMPKVLNNTLSEEEQRDLLFANILKMTGAAYPDFGEMLLSSTLNACAIDRENDRKVNAIANALMAHQPKDEIEGMLISRLIALHTHYMKYMAQATAPEASSESVDMRLNRSTKLMRIYNETLDALNKHRRKGNQQITVQHVHVNDGGQAVVGGSINTGGQGEGQ